MTDRKLGVDIGGTDIKFGVVEDGKIIAKKKVPTRFKENYEDLVDYIATECKKIIDDYSVGKVGVGVPGDVKDNIVVKSGNLPFVNTPLADMLCEKIGKKVNIENDAKCAALGEVVFGKGKEYKNMIMLTIGTGIGGCIIINNEIYRGKGYAGELGHMIINIDGKDCPCGHKGCLEQYASATALVDEALNSANDNKNSILFKIYEENGKIMDGKIFFEALAKGCHTAEKVYNSYSNYLSDGLNSIIKVFDPDIVVISGGITKEGNAFLNPITKKIKYDVPVIISVLQGDAGILGATLI